MLIIRDRFGNEIFESEDYEEIVDFANKFKKENSVRVVQILKKSGMHHSYI